MASIRCSVSSFCAFFVSFCCVFFYILKKPLCHTQVTRYAVKIRPMNACTTLLFSLFSFNCFCFVYQWSLVIFNLRIHSFSFFFSLLPPLFSLLFALFYADLLVLCHLERVSCAYLLLYLFCVFMVAVQFQKKKTAITLTTSVRKTVGKGIAC